MADFVLSQVFGTISKRYRDMGDGSHAEVVALGAVSAAKLAKDAQSRTTITCTPINTDVAAAATIPAGTKYILVSCNSDCFVAVDEATSATVGARVPVGQAVTFPITFGASGGDSKVHAQSPTDNAVVHITYLKD